MGARRGLVTLAGLAVALAGCGGGGTARPAATATATAAPLPAPDGALPRTTAGLAAQLADVAPRMRRAARAWDGRGAVPPDLTRLALREQRLTLHLGLHPSRLRPVLAALPARERPAVRAAALAERDLARLSAGWPVRRRYRTGPPAPAARLWRAYGEAHRRFGVARRLLAAVNLVESQFGRLRNESVAGAQGPMQFMPATWAAYGLGGDVRDPRDAILGAANLLHANGSPGDDATALHHYNPSRLYVRAVLRYARRAASPAGFRALYARQVFVRAGDGSRRRRITGP